MFKCSNIYNLLSLDSWKPYFWGPKNQSFRNKSGKAQLIRAKFGIHGHVKGWQRSGNFGRDRPILGKMGGWDKFRGARVFLCGNPDDRQLRNRRFSPNLVTKRNSVSRRWIRKDILENFYFRGHFPPKSKIASRSNRHLTQSRLQVTGCTAERYCLLHVLVQGPGRFCTTYGCGATERQSCRIFGFLPIFLIQNA